MLEQIQRHRPNAAPEKPGLEQPFWVMIEGLGGQVVLIGDCIQIYHVGVQVDDLEPGPLQMQQSDVEPSGPGFEFEMIGEINRQFEDVVLLPYRLQTWGQRQLVAAVIFETKFPVEGDYYRIVE